MADRDGITASSGDEDKLWAGEQSCGLESSNSSESTCTSEGSVAVTVEG